MKLHPALLLLPILAACSSPPPRRLLDGSALTGFPGGQAVLLPVGEVRLTPEGERSAGAVALAEELEEASVSLAGPSRLDSAFASGRPLPRWRSGERDVFPLRLVTRDGTEGFVLVVEYDPDRRWTSAVAYALDPGADDEEAVELARVGPTRSRVASARFPSDPYEALFARMKLEGGARPRLLYHGTLCLLDWDQERFRPQLTELLLKRSEAIRAAPGDYPLAFLLLGRERFNETPLIAELARTLLGAQRHEPQLLAAALLVLGGERQALLLAGARDALASERWEVREVGVRALHAARAPADEDRVLALLRDPRAEVRQAVLDSARDYALTSAQLPVLTPCLEDEAWRVRQAAVSAITMIPGSPATRSLVGRLADSDPDVRQAAARALEGRALVLADLSALVPLRSSSTWQTRRVALRLIGRIPGDEATRALIPAVEDSDSDVRAQALEELTRRSQSGGTGGMLKLVGDEDGEVRRKARHELKRRPLENHVPSLLALLASGSWKVRLDALELLSQVKTLDDDAMAALIARAQDADSDVREAAWRQLDRRSLGAPQLPAIDALLGANAWQIRRRGVHLVGRIPGVPATKRLVRSCRDSDSDVRQAAFEELRARKDAWATQGLIGMLGKQPGASRELAGRDLTPQLDRLLQVLDSDVWQAREAAVGLLAGVALGVKGRASLLARVLDSDSDVRAAALAEAKKRRYGNADLPALAKVLKAPNWQTRVFGLELVASVSTLEAEQLLLTLENDPDNDVRSALLRLLAKRRRAGR